MQDNCFAQRNTINVLVSKCEGDVNYKLFGTNLLLYKSKWPPHNQYSDYGAGIWDAAEKKHNLEVIDLANDCNISFVRYMSGSKQHDWKKGVGKRSDYLYGLDEYMRTCEMLNAETNIVINYWATSIKDSADLVTYLNVKAEDALIKILYDMPSLSDDLYDELFKKYVRKKDGINWNNYRAINGRLQPYNAKFFEIGNEVYNSKFGVSSKSYAEKYREYYKAMKTIDKDINVGALFHLNNNKWNKEIVNLIQEEMDFGVVHIYPSAYENNVLEHDYLKRQFYLLEQDIPNKLKMLFEKIKDIPLAVTEFNGGYFQWKDRKLRWSLGNSLLNAEILKMLMQKNMNIIFSNNWNLINEGWGMIANGFRWDQKDLYNYYYKRPNYYIFKMYAYYFGDVLIDADVKCDAYDVGTYQTFKAKMENVIKYGAVIGRNLLSDEWIVSEFDGAYVRVKQDVLEIDFNCSTKFNFFHARKKVKVKSDTYYKVSGYIRTEGYEDDKGFCLEIQDGLGFTKTRSAASTRRIKIADDWEYVEAVYKTLPDVESVNVIARRVGSEGPLNGKVFVKDVRLEKFVLSTDTKIPYLSVNASKSEDGKTVYLMVINKNLEEDEETEIILNDFVPDGVARIYTLWSKTVDATNEKRPHNNVRIHKNKIKFHGNTFIMNFKKHSLTAIEIKRK